MPIPGSKATRLADGALLAAGLAAALAATAAGGAARARAAARAGERPDPAALAHRVDLARAPEDQLRVLPGVGPRTAARLAAERRARGPFLSPADLDLRMPGVGPARLRSWEGRVLWPGDPGAGR